jgi:hypothetical protein
LELRFKKIIFLNNSGFMFTLFGPIILPASENILSDAVDDAGIGKYLRANILK